MGQDGSKPPCWGRRCRGSSADDASGHCRVHLSHPRHPPMTQITQMQKEVQRNPETYAILGAAMEVHRTLGAGFLEPVYHEALAVELSARGIPYVRQME